MSTVAERLVESWLDSQSERRYQPALIQLLVTEGWRVLHNTRHSPLEFGKDVIARDPSGQLFAIQLKGNPGSRLTKSQAQDMLPQVIELIDVPVPSIYKKHPDEKHISVVATNGEVDEEARTLFELAALRTDNPACPSSELKLWARGELLARFREKLAEVWPTSVEGSRQILELYTQNGRSLVDPKIIAVVLNASVGRPTSSMRSPEKTAKLSTALLLSEVIKSPWYSAENHYVLYQISTLIAVYCLRYADNATRRGMLREYDDVILGHCADLLLEAERQNYDPEYTWSAGSPIDEIDVMRERLRLISDCAATLVLGPPGEVSYARAYAAKLIDKSYGPGSIWGEAAVPSAIVRYWAFRRLDATAKPDAALRAILRGLVAVARRGGSGIPGPYYGFEECLFLQTGGLIGTESDIGDDETKGHSWFALPIMYMLAKRNWKQSCKNLWPPFSKLLHENVDLETPDFFDAKLSKEGKAVTQQLYSSTWPALVRLAVETGQSLFPSQLDDRAWLIAAYIALVPYRAWTEVLLWLDSRLAATWYNDNHLPPT